MGLDRVLGLCLVLGYEVIASGKEVGVSDLTKEQLNTLEVKFGIANLDITLYAPILIAMARRTLEVEADLAEAKDEANKLRMELEIERGELHFSLDSR